jgi:heme/copper-type cytochrome/quinol oxidase subunit 2
VAAVAVLLAVAVTGLRARGPLQHTPNQTAAGASGTVLVIALSAAEVLAVIAFLVVLAAARPQRQPKPDEDDEERWRPNIPWYAKTVLVLLAVAALVTPFAVLFTRKPRSLKPPPLAGAPRPQVGHAITTASSSIWPLITGMVIAIVIVVTLTLRTRRRRAQPQDSTHRTSLTTLLASLAAARDALANADEPRAAIIACYAAMERGFAAAGSVPAAADTPAEVLARATRAGLVRPAPAETLTGLFRRARYSTNVMTGADSRDAADALTELRADLLASEQP